MELNCRDSFTVVTCFLGNHCLNPDDVALQLRVCCVGHVRQGQYFPFPQGRIPRKGLLRPVCAPICSKSVKNPRFRCNPSLVVNKDSSGRQVLHSIFMLNHFMRDPLHNAIYKVRLSVFNWQKQRLLVQINFHFKKMSQRESHQQVKPPHVYDMVEDMLIPNEFHHLNIVNAAERRQKKLLMRQRRHLNAMRILKAFILLQAIEKDLVELARYCDERLQEINREKVAVQTLLRNSVIPPRKRLCHQLQLDHVCAKEQQFRKTRVDEERKLYRFYFLVYKAKKHISSSLVKACS